MTFTVVCLLMATLILGAVDIYLIVRLSRTIANRRVPVIIEDVTPAGTFWLVSFDGHNPAPEMCIACASREEAHRLKAILGAA